MKRHVAVIMSNFWPEPTGGSPTATEFAVFFQRAGVPVRVATSMPYYPQWEIWPEYRGALWRREFHEGVEINRSWHRVSPRVNTLMRMLQEATLSLFALPSFVRVLRGARKVYLFTPALSFAWVGSLWARLFRIPRVVVVKDVMPDAAIELGMLSNPFMIGLSRMMARSLYRHAEEIHTLGEGMRSRIARLCNDPTKIRLVPDTVDGSELYPVPLEDNAFRARFVPPGTFAVLHTGNMGKKQDLFLVLRAAALLRDDPGIHFYVFGDGAVKNAFLKERHRLGLDNVSHHPLQDRPMLKHMLSGADVVLVSQLREVVDIVVPSKLLTSMVSGAMIIAACPPDSEPHRILTESGGGVVIPAEDEEALVGAIRDIRAEKTDVEACRRAAREYALEHFDRDAVYGRLLAEYGVEAVPGSAGETVPT